MKKGVLAGLLVLAWCTEQAQATEGSPGLAEASETTTASITAAVSTCIDLDFKTRTIGKTIPAVHYVVHKIVTIPVGVMEPGIPEFIRYSGRPGTRRKFPDTMWNKRITDDGDILVVTLGPTRNHRRIYVFNEQGKMVSGFHHNLPWVNGIDMDDDGNILCFVGKGINLNPDVDGIVDLRGGTDISFKPQKPYVVAFGRDGQGVWREDLDCDPDFIGVRHAHNPIRGLLPLYYHGQYWFRMDTWIGSKRKVFSESVKYHNPPELMSYAATKISSTDIIVGRREDVYFEKHRNRVNTYGLILRERECVKGAHFLGGSNRLGCFIGVGIKDRHDSSYEMILRLNRKGECIERIIMDDGLLTTYGIQFVDSLGRIYFQGGKRFTTFYRCERKR